jgi:hypothetical protein
MDLLEWYGLEPNDVERVMKMAKSEAEVLISAKPAPAPAGVVLPRGNTELTLPDGATPPSTALPAPTP